jgi:ABC-2 type transport system ATP-binding protein
MKYPFRMPAGDVRGFPHEKPVSAAEQKGACMNKIIEVKNLKKNYGDFVAVNSIDFDIMHGEIFGLLGPNGAGKTTTINMLIGLARTSEGKIFYEGADLTNKIKKAQEVIGVVADESNLYDEMSGFENLCFCGSLYGMHKDAREKKARALLELFQLRDTADKKFKAYSKGMKRKLTIAAALVHDPEILFLDEPTTGIDVASVRQIRNLIKNLNSQGTTIFLTTHYIEEAERLCDRVALIDRGRIIKIDTVKRLIDATRESDIIEVTCESIPLEGNVLQKRLSEKFPDVECILKDERTVRITGPGKIDIAPIVSYLSSEGMSIYEAKLLRPSLEDAFVKITGIEIDMMKREKEKK